MKKKFCVVLLVLAMTTILMTGCGEKTVEEVPYDYDLGEYVKVVDYHDLPFMIQTAEVTDEDVEKEIQTILEYASTVENATTGIVEDGDTINIAFAGRIDGELFEGGSSESYDLTVGTTSMIDGFVEGLVGKNVGETVTLDLQFPEDYHSEAVAGKPVVFEVTINSKRIVSKPEFNDEFVQANTDFQTAEEYRQSLKETLTTQMQETLDAEIKDALWEVIVTGSEVIQYPEEELAAANAVANSMEEEYKAQATLYGLEWADFLSMFMGTDEDGFAQMKEEYAQSVVLSDMVLYKMARDENVSITQSEFDEKTREILAESSFTEESFQASYGMTIFEYAEANGWKDSFLLEKVMDKVVEYGHEVSKEEFEEYVNDALGNGASDTTDEDLTETEAEGEGETGSEAENEGEGEGDGEGSESEGSTEDTENTEEPTEDESQETEGETEGN